VEVLQATEEGKQPLVVLELVVAGQLQLDLLELLDKDLLEDHPQMSLVVAVDQEVLEEMQRLALTVQVVQELVAILLEPQLSELLAEVLEVQLHRLPIAVMVVVLDQEEALATQQIMVVQA
jgi:hypothetical protein